jgi:ATP synthase mitochondrial F1 complex assembly factor 2
MASLRPLSNLSRQFIRINSRNTRSIHASLPKSANPIPHPTAPGPPPPAPEPVIQEPEDRVARKRKQADLLSEARNARTNAQKPSSPLKKRFWKEVSVKETPDGLQIFLDSRPVRTASKATITLPHSKRHLATAIAVEWDQLVSAQQALKQQHIPLTSLVSRALDIQAADDAKDPSIRESIVRMLLRYLHTDTLLCWVPRHNVNEPNSPAEENRASLRETQMRIAKPIIAHLATNVWPGVQLVPVLEEDSILPAEQPRMTVEVVRGWLTGMPAFELAGMERAVLATKSLLVAVRMLVDWSEQYAHLREGSEEQARFGIEDAAEACSLEVLWQTGQWGEVEDTHDVDREDLRRQLGGVILLVHGDKV